MVPGPDGRLISTQERMDNVRAGQVQQNGMYPAPDQPILNAGLAIPCIFLYLCCFRCILLLKACHKAEHPQFYGTGHVRFCI